MDHLGEHKRGMEIGRVLDKLRDRTSPIVHEQATIQEVIHAIIEFEHSRVLYVQNEMDELTGTISLGLLAKHVFSPSHVPRIHARLLIGMITTETAKDLMQKRPIFAVAHEDIGTVLKRMIEANVKEIPIVDEHRKIIGDVTMLDLLKFLLNSVGETERENDDGQ